MNRPGVPALAEHRTRNKLARCYLIAGNSWHREIRCGCVQSVVNQIRVFRPVLVSKLSRSARKATDMIRHSRATSTTASLLVWLLNNRSQGFIYFFSSLCLLVIYSFLFFPPQNIHILAIQWGTLWVAGGLWSSRLPSTGCRVKTLRSSHCWPRRSGCREPFTPSSEWSQVMLSLHENIHVYSSGGKKKAFWAFPAQFELL